MLIDNKWMDSLSDEIIEVYNPANEEIIGSVPKGETEDAKKALEAAQCAFKNWSALPVSKPVFNTHENPNSRSKLR